MQWFKLYVEARNDAKLRSLSDTQFRVWFNLLCFASEQSARGVIDVEDAQLLAIEVAGGDLVLLDETCAALHALRIVTCVTSSVTGRYITFLNFEKRQGANVTRNTRSSAERVRKHRQRKKLQHDETYVTRVTPCNADVTRVTPLELEGEEEKEEENTPPNPLRGEGVCVSINGGKPIPIEDAPKPLLPQVDPAELARVQAKADHLFPTMDFGFKVHGTAASFPLAWIDRALDDMHAKGKAYWPFLLGILRRYDAEGGPARASPGQPNREAKSKAQDDAFDRLGDDPEFLEACNQIKGVQ